jgi:hypothetical protein
MNETPEYSVVNTSTGRPKVTFMNCLVTGSFARLQIDRGPKPAFSKHTLFSHDFITNVIGARYVPQRRGGSSSFSAALASLDR